MKVYEFPGKVDSRGNLEVPNDVVELLPDNETVRVIIVVDEPNDTNEDADWSRLAAEQFLKGYADVDAIYDNV